MLTENRSHLQRYGTAILAVAIALALTLLSGSLLQPTPTVLFFAAVTLSVWYGGLKPGLLATVLSALTINYFFTPPLYTLHISLGDLLRFGVFGLVVLLCNSLIEAYRRKEAALRRKEELLRLITDSLPTPVSYVDASLHYRFNNQAYENWFGIPRTEITGKHLKEILEESDYQVIQPHLEAVLTGENVTFERCVPYRDGSVRYIDAAYIPDIGKKGEVRGFVVLVNDITNRKQAEQALQEAHDRLEKRVSERTAELTAINAALQEQIRERQEAEAQLQFHANVLSQVSDVVLAVDNNYRIVYWNQAAERFYGVTAEEAIGRLRKEVYEHRWLKPEEEQETWEELGTKGYWSGEVIHILKSGEEKWVEAAVSALKDAQSNTSGYLAVVRDVTVRKQAEEALLISDAALQQMPDAILLTDLQGNILRWMGKAEQIFGYTPEEAIGKPVNFLHRPDIKEKMTAEIIRSIQETGTFFGEIPCLRKDGSSVPIETSAKTLGDKAGNPLFLVGINRDITDRKQAEENRAQLIREQAARVAAEATQWRLNFLAQTSRLLATSLDYEITLANVAGLVVPELADWCVIHIIEEDNSLRPVVMVHQDPAKQSLMQEILDNYQPDDRNSLGYPKVIRTGESELISEFTDDLLVKAAQSAEQLEKMRQLGLKSNLCVPLKARGQILGALSLATAESGRCYKKDDLCFAFDLAERIALAVDNARLYRQAQKALQQQAESLALIDALLRASPVAVGFLDRELRYIRVNQVLADINGFPVEQHLGRRYRDLLPKEAERFESQLQQVLDTGTPQLNVEFSGEAPGQPGRFGYWLANYYPVRGSDGQIMGVGVMVADITETKRTSQALREAEERLRVAIENSPITVFNQDRELRYTWIYNPAFAHQIETPIGKCDEDLMASEDAAILTEIKSRVLETGIGTREEVKITMQGQNFYYDLTVEPLQNEAGETVGITCAAVDISDRKLAELALRRSEERYRAFVEQSTEGIWRFELEKPLPIETPENEQLEHFYQYAYLAECNNVFAQMYGYTVAEELIGGRLENFLVRSDLHNLEYLQSFIRMGYRLSDRESNEVDRLGNFKCFANNLVGIIENGFLVRAWGTQRDITSRKRAESMLRYLAETSSFLSTSLEYEATLQRVAQLPVPHLADWCAVDILQPDGPIRRMPVAYADPAKIEWARKLQQYPLDRNSDSPVVRVMQTGIPQLIPEILDELLAKSTRNPEHLAVLRAMGMKSTMIVPLVVDEEILGTISFVSAESNRRYSSADLALAIDFARRAALAIDNAKLYQEARSQRQKAEHAKERTASLQAIAAAFSESLTPTQVASVVVDRGIAALGAMAGSVVLLEDAGNCLKILATIGYPAGLFDDWNYRPGISVTPLADTVFTGEPIFLENTQAFVTRYPNLADLPTLTRSSAFAAIPLTVEGRTIGGLGLSFADPQEFSIADRTFMLALGQQCAQAIARARLYEAEQLARSQAEAANRIKDEFLAVLSHELRTPLNPILGWAKLLRSGKFDEAKTDRALETIERNAKLQTQLIEDLLDVSRILQGKLSLNVSPINLVSIIEAALETVHLAAEAKSIQITTLFEPNVGQVSGDPNRLQQVVWNLLSNAVKFTPSGGRVEVKLLAVMGDRNSQLPIANYAQIQIRDTGKGINPDFLPHVFDYFRQENSTTTRVFGGLGLGLAIVRHLVELHGGTVFAESPGEGLGATFTVRLPLLQDEGRRMNDESEILASSSMPNSLQGMRLLVVDDEVDTRDLLVFILEECGAEVRAVASAKEALEIFRIWQPDILLSDIGMPEMDGYMLINRIRNMPPTQGGQIPAIALTAYAGETNHQQVLKAGFNKHITKPIEPAELAGAIANLLEQRQ